MDFGILPVRMAVVSVARTASSTVLWISVEGSATVERPHPRRS